MSDKARQLKWPLVRVSWVDSHGPHGWHSLDFAIGDHPMECESVGWLIQDASDRITLMAHIQAPETANPCVDGVITIPRVAITQFVRLGGRRP